jgi:small subunit ribosomal protein S16
MVRIRLRRVGLKKQPSYRIVVTDQRRPRDGGFIEIIGHHNPRTRPSTDVINEERALYWLGVGAQPSEAVQRLMRRTGTWDRFERLRKGEAVETLVAEAQAAIEAAEPISPRTQYPSPGPGQGKKAAAAAAAATTAEAVAEEPVAETVADEPAAEAEAEEPAVEEEPVAEVAEEEPAAEAEAEEPVVEEEPVAEVAEEEPAAEAEAEEPAAEETEEADDADEGKPENE